MITKFLLPSPLFIFVLFLSSQTVFSQGVPSAHYHLLSGSNFVQSKNYYLLTLFQSLPDVKKLLSGDTILQSVGKNKTASLKTALQTCDKDGLCFINAMKLSDAEIDMVAARLAALCHPGNALAKLVSEHLVPSGAYVLFQQLPPAEMLVKAWMQDASGINFAIAVYAEGKKPNYPNIDSISLHIHDPRNSNTFFPGYTSLLYNTISLISVEQQQAPGFFGPSLSAALYFIEMNEREQAADYEPMITGENKAAYDRIKATRWDAYPYSLIMIPGAGPEDPTVALSAEGMIRCKLAALQYRKGVAPFIVTSGGKVHPYKTRYCEAIEMKKYLVKKLGIPANVILIDPHARHTTTNMRNTVRLMYRYGMPFSKPALTCTTRGQSTMIETTLIARCLKELNEAPYKNGKRLSETEMEFFPLIEALQINPMEPMDP